MIRRRDMWSVFGWLTTALHGEISAAVAGSENLWDSGLTRICDTTDVGSVVETTRAHGHTTTTGKYPLHGFSDFYCYRCSLPLFERTICRPGDGQTNCIESLDGDKSIPTFRIRNCAAARQSRPPPFNVLFFLFFSRTRLGLRKNRVHYSGVGA